MVFIHHLQAIIVKSIYNAVDGYPLHLLGDLLDWWVLADRVGTPCQLAFSTTAFIIVAIVGIASTSGTPFFIPGPPFIIQGHAAD